LPPGVTNDGVLVQQRFDQIPANAIWARLARTTLQPGASMIQGMPQHHGVGPMIYRIDAGSVTGQADGPIEVTRAGAAAPTQVAANTAIVLATGDIAFAPSGVGVQWRNAGGAPAKVLESGVAIPPIDGIESRMNHGTEAPGWTAGDVSFEDLIDDYTTFVPPAAPAELTVTQVTIAPGASLPGEPQPGLKLVSVEKGTLTVVWAKPTAANVSTGTHDFVAGSWMDVNTNASFAAQLRNAGTEPLVLLVMTLTPVGTETGTPAA
jgi:quercetin dioxygenase-like cupin family protein